MLSYTDLKKGILFVKDGEPYEVLESNFSRMQQRKAVVQTKIKNLISGKIIEESFQPSDQFDEANIEKRTLLFLYNHRGDFVFCDPKNRSNRFSIIEENIGNKIKWLKANTEITAMFFDGKLINLSLPIKMDFKVRDAPPGVQGDRATAGTKSVTIETGAVIQVPPFINTGDTIRINTESGQYTERIEKGS